MKQKKLTNLTKLQTNSLKSLNHTVNLSERRPARRRPVHAGHVSGRGAHLRRHTLLRHRLPRLQKGAWLKLALTVLS